MIQEFEKSSNNKFDVNERYNTAGQALHLPPTAVFRGKLEPEVRRGKYKPPHGGVYNNFPYTRRPQGGIKPFDSSLARPCPCKQVHGLAPFGNKYLYEDGKIIGWYRYSVWPREENNNRVVRKLQFLNNSNVNAHTLDIVVNQNFQGKGLGKMLMEDLILDCKKRGFKKLMIRTIEGNIQSYKLHERNGFKIAFRKGTDIVWEINFE